MTNISVDTVIESLRKAVAAKGEDYVYAKVDDICVYVENGAPSCLVGHVIADLFPETLPEVAEYEHGDHDSDFVSVQQVFEFPLEPEAVRLLKAAQNYQDIGEPWGEALDKALKGVLV